MFPNISIFSSVGFSIHLTFDLILRTSMKFVKLWFDISLFTVCNHSQFYDPWKNHKILLFDINYWCEFSLEGSADDDTEKINIFLLEITTNIYL